MFNGSYNADDVTFLLKQINLSSTNLEDKERNIQKGKAHYSEMITHEKAPKKEYTDIFHDAVKLNGEKFAYHIWLLADKILKDYKDSQEIVLVSLARAGTPVGVLLNRLLKHISKKKISHYSISIIRDRGVDKNAISFILNNHKDTYVVFLDGWTGKGVIGQELKESIDVINQEKNVQISSNLYVVADISGTAYWSATDEDYLLPSAVLNSTVSGLVSRTILNTDYIGENDFHGCIYYEELKESDLSVWFVDKIFNLILEKLHTYEYNDFNFGNKQETKIKSIETIEFFLNKYNFNNRNFIKPGVGESTRVLLRRIPKEIWIKDINDVSLKHIVFLAKNKNIPLHINSELSYNAIAVIDEVD
jgi:uncharacterized protein (UPF0248 family)